ncbi:uncharacterized protein LOC110449016 isoform X2 [Mizuhopecten yessoensis]|nr:uncharacterized protein LOC110449016 isoform X2 [Mizuhopecten yessoensis]
MAYRLKEEGYTRVKIFEKNDYIGGKSKTLYHRRVPHEMGTVYTQPDYTEIYKLVKEFDAGDILPMPSPDIWVSKNPPIYMTTLENSIRILMKNRPNITTPTEAAGIIQQSIVKYVGLHNTLFGTYEGELMPRPCENVLSQVNMTFEVFLTTNNIEGLEGIILSALTMQGYGHIDEISALYGMMWVTPQLLLGLVKPIITPEDRVVKILSKGFQSLWEQIARQNNLNVKLSSPVKTVSCLKHGRGFCVKYMKCGRLYGEKFDFIITSPTMKSMSDIIRFKPKVRELFSKTFNDYFTTTLADTDYGVNRGKTPQDYYAFNIIAKEESSVWGHRDSYSSLNYIIEGNYTEGNPGGQNVQSSVYYQLSKQKPDPKTLTRKLRAHISTVEVSDNLKIKDRFIWNYFPRYSVSDMASGILWDIFDIQGKHNIWYIGSSVSFESVKSVVEYNNLLLRQLSGNN